MSRVSFRIFCQYVNFATFPLHQLQNTKAKQNRGSRISPQVFHSEQEALRACELAGEHCQAISKQNEDAAFVYTLESNLNLIMDANSTLYVKAKFTTNLGKYTVFITGLTTEVMYLFLHSYSHDFREFICILLKSGLTNRTHFSTAYARIEHSNNTIKLNVQN